MTPLYQNYHKEYLNIGKKNAQKIPNVFSINRPINRRRKEEAYTRQEDETALISATIKPQAVTSR
jgi:GTP-dependent phosphoenolpyruvate carboxykinase